MWQKMVKRRKMKDGQRKRFWNAKHLIEDIEKRKDARQMTVYERKINVDRYIGRERYRIISNLKRGGEKRETKHSIGKLERSSKSKMRLREYNNVDIPPLGVKSLPWVAASLRERKLNFKSKKILRAKSPKSFQRMPSNSEIIKKRNRWRVMPWRNWSLKIKIEQKWEWEKEGARDGSGVYLGVYVYVFI